MPTVRRTLTILIPDDADVRATLEASRRVRQTLSPLCFNEGDNLSAIALQRAAYHTVKGTLSAQMTCSAIRSVAAAYQSAKSNRHPAQAPFAFHRPLALFLIGKRGRDAAFTQDGLLSLWTVHGRKRIAYTVPEAFRQRFAQAKSHDSLIIIEQGARLIGRLTVTLEVPDGKGSDPVGIDMGETNALTAVDGQDDVLFISGREVKVRNRRTHKTRKRLQKLLAARKAQSGDTRSVRRRLKRLGRKQRNRTIEFVRLTACKLFAWIKSNSLLVWERLNIPQVRKGTIRGKALRRRLSLWQRRLLRQACSSKAQMLGVPEAEVNPAYTSQDCSRCGKRGQRRKHRFVCPHCGHSEHADR